MDYPALNLLFYNLLLYSFFIAGRLFFFTIYSHYIIIKKLIAVYLLFKIRNKALHIHIVKNYIIAN